MAKSKTAAGKTFWSRIAGAFGISEKKTVSAAVKKVAIHKKVRRTKKHIRSKTKKHSKSSTKRHPKKSRKHAIRHRTRYRSISRGAPKNLLSDLQAPPPTLKKPRIQRTWSIPRPHLPQVLFKEIELPSITLPAFHRKQKPTAAPAEEAVSEETSDQAATDALENSLKSDLADLLSSGEETADEAVKPSKKKKKEEPAEIAEDLIEPTQETSEAVLEKSPEESQKEEVAAETRTAVIAAKRKRVQAAEIVLQAPLERSKKAEAKKEKKKVEVTPPPTEDEVLEAMETKARTRKKKKGMKSFFRSINNIGMGSQRAAFVQNLAMMLNAGLPLIDALQTIREELRSKAMRKVIQQISDLVEGGNALWISMDEQGLFSPYEVSLVRVGEEAGNLARNMELLSIQQEKDHNLRQKVKMAMIYPTIVLVLMFIIVMGLGMFVLPNLIQVLYALNVELPLSTRIVIGFTEFMQHSGAQTAAGIIGGFIAVLLLTKYTSFKAITQWFIFKIPGIGRLAREASIARFGVILGGLLQAGVPLVESMDSMVEVTTIVSYKRFYQKLRDRIVVGDSFATSFHSIRGSRKVLPVSVQQLIITGEKSGALSDTCMKVAHIFERKAEETAEKLPVILEPVLLLCIGSLVGFIAFSIIVPIYSAVGNVSGG